MRRTLVVGAMTAMVLLAAACDRGEDTPGTTSAPEPTSAPSTVAAPDTTPASTAPTTTTTAAEETGDAPNLVAGMPSYEVVERVESTDGEELVVLVEPGTYTNVELENLVFDIVDRFRPLTATVVDDPEVVALALADELTPEQEALLEQHTFLELVDGVDVTFRGPYSDLTGIVIGS